MSDTTSIIPEPPAVPEVPPAPAAPEVAAPVTSGSKEGTKDVSATPATEAASETPAEAATASAPVVVNDDNGQHVVLADGSSVTTRSHAYPVSNTEWEKYELTHSGDQARYSLVPGDEHYSPYSDPSIPNSHLAQMVEREIQSFADRILHDAEAVVSPLWHGLQGVYQGELKQAIATGGGSGKVEA